MDEAGEIGQDPLILVSNRGPVEFSREDGERTANPGHGGLVTALAGLASHLEDAVWVCAALSDEDAVVAQEHGGKAFDHTGPGPRIRLRLVDLDGEAQHKFYAVIANPMLWFVQHSLWNPPYSPDITRRELDAFENGYRAVNRCFADAVAEEVDARGGRATVMVQDYHLYLLPEQVRARCPEVFLHHFVHIPWPQPDAWLVLPPAMRRAVFEGVLGNDLVAFHSRRYARNFLLGCEELLDLEVDMRELAVEVGGRVVRAGSYPISVDAEELEARADTADVREREQRLSDRRREHLIVRADRADPSKNILRGFRAFDTLLDDHPELAGRVTFRALVQPSREDVQQYVDYLDEIQRLVDEINGKHGTDDWQPIELSLEGDFDEVLAAYRSFDVLVVNPIADGMNLVAKEGALVNQRDGVLALSENAGAYGELGQFAVTLHPFDIQQQADAIFAALTMDAEERRDRLAGAAKQVREHTVTKWLRDQLHDIRQQREAQPRSGSSHS
jgi:trehalose 6-phosphate synthase